MSNETVGVAGISRRRVLVVSVGRSDYGIYRPVLNAMEAHPALQPELLVSGAHLGENGASTLGEIIADARTIVARVPLPATGGGSLDVGLAMAEALAGGCRAMDLLKPDILMVLGDRFEMFGFASAAIPLNIPIVHIHGGELSYGAIDDVFRHAITKMSHIHFASTAGYAQRIRQMGEENWRVHVSGAPALDTIRQRGLPSRSALAQRFGLRLDEAPILVTYHPMTRSPEEGIVELRSLLAVLEATGRPIVMTGPNADAGADALRAELKAFANRLERASFIESFGADNYLAMLREAACVVGNSSSGIIETPSFRLPTVNIGDRQAGRTRAPNIIDTTGDTPALTSAVKRALDPAFRASLATMESPYGNGFAGEYIADVLAKITLDATLINKRFADKDCSV